MKEKIIERLNKAYSNLGLSNDIIEFRADVLSKTLTEESQIDDAVKAEEDFFKLIQSFGDKRAAGKKGNGKKGNKGENGDETDETKDVNDVDGLKKLIENQNKLIETLSNRVNELDGSHKQKSFDELVSKVASEVGLKGDMLDLAKAKLSSDMDETAIRNSLGASKQIFIKCGANFENESNGKFLSEEDAARKNAAEWVKSNEIKD